MAPDAPEDELVTRDDLDGLDLEDRERLHASIARAEEQFQAGKGIPADVALAELARLRKR